MTGFFLPEVRGEDHPLTADEITDIIYKEGAAKVRTISADLVAQFIAAAVRSGTVIASADGRLAAAVKC